MSSGALIARWDGGAVEIAGTLDEGDEVAGFRVVHLPGHAPGLIALFRDSDRLALVSDTSTPSTPRADATSPPTFPIRRSTRTPSRPAQRSASWPRSTRDRVGGHAEPVTGDVQAQLERAASAPA